MHKIHSYLFLKLYILRKVIDHRNIWQDLCPQVDNWFKNKYYKNRVCCKYPSLSLNISLLVTTMSLVFDQLLPSTLDSEL